MHAYPALLAMALAVLAATATAKVYTRCELAVELKNKHGFTRSELPDWLCLARYESNYNTAARNVNYTPRYGAQLGIFQINDYFWCDEAVPKGTNSCNIKCSDLTNDIISSDVACARKIKSLQGFTAWSGWTKYCKGKNLSGFLTGCNV